jgi:hypothetical protein
VSHGRRVRAPGPLPWRRPKHELLLLVLVAAAALLLVYPPGAEDWSRMCLTRALVDGRLSADACHGGGPGDYASYGGHLYSDKAPAVSVFAVPAAEIVRLPAPASWVTEGDPRLWAVRLSTNGIALILCAFLLGRVAEGLAPGWGGASLVVFALGTIASGVVPAGFAHLPAATFGFAAFLLAWARRPLAGGLVAGLALPVEYQTGLIVLGVGAYAAFGGWRPLLRYAIGVAPGVALLGAYDWGAFGSPFHLSYRYVTDQFAEGMAKGFFGVRVPSLHGLHLVLTGNRGLLLVSPVLVAAAFGLLRLWREGHRPEAALCAAVTIAFLVLDSGYYLPYGGDSPGPRFFVPALPFLALGLAPAFRARPGLTTALGVPSVIASTAIALTWPAAVNSAPGYRDTVWREIVDFVGHGSGSRIAGWVQKTVLDWANVGRLGSAGLVFALALGALAIALQSGWSARAPVRPRAPA